MSREKDEALIKKFAKNLNELAPSLANTIDFNTKLDRFMERIEIRLDRLESKLDSYADESRKRAFNSTCVKDDSTFNWITKFEKQLPNLTQSISTFFQFKQLKENDLKTLLQYYELSYIVNNEEANRRMLATFLGIPTIHFI
ncbi:unnamed protein product [Brachionus calyciflorus]|uniref:Uncharacterized protein n=1 Tax=Brachionus calyciflorus TaxID=104777 RepID=A0A814IXS7_9BILA|nr:unnamed protein product [Brachionus calyciflorus]